MTSLQRLALAGALLLAAGSGCLVTGVPAAGIMAADLATRAIQSHTTGEESPTPLPRLRGVDFYTAREQRPATRYDPYSDYDFGRGNTGPRRE